MLLQRAVVLLRCAVVGGCGVFRAVLGQDSASHDLDRAPTPGVQCRKLPADVSAVIFDGAVRVDGAAASGVDLEVQVFRELFVVGLFDFGVFQVGFERGELGDLCVKLLLADGEALLGGVVTLLEVI